jgi:hypothetical protein
LILFPAGGSFTRYGAMTGGLACILGEART